jgi:hypothetical protein
MTGRCADTQPPPASPQPASPPSCEMNARLGRARCSPLTQRYRCVSVAKRVRCVSSAPRHASQSFKGESNARTEADGSCRGRRRRALLAPGHARRRGGSLAFRAVGLGTRPRSRGEARHAAIDRGRRRGAATGAVRRGPRLLRESGRLFRATQLLCAASGVLPTAAGLLRSASTVLPARAGVCSCDAAALYAAARLLSVPDALRWLLRCPEFLPPTGRLRLSRPLRITAARRLARHVMAADRRAPPLCSCAIESWKSPPSCS